MSESSETGPLSKGKEWKSAPRGTIFPKAMRDKLYQNLGGRRFLKHKKKYAAQGAPLNADSEESDTATDEPDKRAVSFGWMWAVSKTLPAGMELGVNARYANEDIDLIKDNIPEPQQEPYTKSLENLLQRHKELLPERPLDNENGSNNHDEISNNVDHSRKENGTTHGKEGSSEEHSSGNEASSLRNGSGAQPMDVDINSDAGNGDKDQLEVTENSHEEQSSDPGKSDEENVPGKESSDVELEDIGVSHRFKKEHAPSLSVAEEIREGQELELEELLREVAVAEAKLAHEWKTGAGYTKGISVLQVQCEAAVRALRLRACRNVALADIARQLYDRRTSIEKACVEVEELRRRASFYPDIDWRRRIDAPWVHVEMGIEDRFRTIIEQVHACDLIVAKVQDGDKVDEKIIPPASRKKRPRSDSEELQYDFSEEIANTSKKAKHTSETANGHETTEDIETRASHIRKSVKNECKYAKDGPNVWRSVKLPLTPMEEHLLLSNLSYHTADNIAGVLKADDKNAVLTADTVPVPPRIRTLEQQRQRVVEARSRICQARARLEAATVSERVLVNAAEDFRLSAPHPQQVTEQIFPGARYK